MKGEPYEISVSKILSQLYNGLRNEVGTVKGLYIFIKSLFWDMIFNKPKWQPEKFNIKNGDQEKFYISKFKEYLPFIIVFNNLNKFLSMEKADRFMADLRSERRSGRKQGFIHPGAKAEAAPYRCLGGVRRIGRGCPSRS